MIDVWLIDTRQSPLGQAIVHRKKTLFDALLPSLEPTRGARSLLDNVCRRGIDVAIATWPDDRESNALLKRAGVDDLIPVRSSKKTMRPNRSPIRTCRSRCAGPMPVPS